MGFVDNIKSFFHSISTEDHYASYDSPYRNSAINGRGQVSGGGSTSRLLELNRLTTVNDSNQSLGEDGGANTPPISRKQSAVAVGYRPGLRSSHTNSDIQLQSLNTTGQPPLPTVDSLWDRIEGWLDEEYPELGDNLNGGVTTADLNEFENDLGSGSLPVDFRQSYKRHDGQFRGGKPTGLIMGLTFLDLESIVEEHAIWAKVSERLEKQQYMVQHHQAVTGKDSATEASSKTAQEKANQINSINSFVANQRSVPRNAIQPYYSHRGWIPFAKDFCGNQLAIDLAPGSLGSWGQIIIFGRDFDTKLVIARSLQEFLFIFVSDLEAGNFQIELHLDDEEYGFLENSRNDDDFVGDDEEDDGDLSFFDKENEFGNVFKGKGKIGYLEVLKMRALRKYGIPNIGNFKTSFVPPNLEIKRPHPGKPTTAGSNTAVPSGSASVSIINLQSSSEVNLPKETLIDDSQTKSTTEPETVEKQGDPKEKSEIIDTLKEEEQNAFDKNETTPIASILNPDHKVEATSEKATEPEGIKDSTDGTPELSETVSESPRNSVANEDTKSLETDMKEVAL